MAKIPSKVATRLIDGLKRYQPIVASAIARDLNEADTSRIVTDILSDVFGFDKYSEITSEFAIRNTYCDLAIKLNGQPKLLIEVKAVGTDLKENHVKQAIDYAANQGMDWVVLTNCSTWRVFKIVFAKPVDKEEVTSFTLPDLNPKRPADLELLFLLAKEGISGSALADYHAQVKAVNRFTLSAVIRSEPVTKLIRRELSRLSPDVKISLSDIDEVLQSEVLKREVIEAEEAKDAMKKILREQTKVNRERATKDPEDGGSAEIETTAPSAHSKLTEAASTEPTE